MGRHSAGDDEQVDLLPARPAVATPPRPGRHASTDGDSGPEGAAPSPVEVAAEDDRTGPKPSPRAADDTSPIPVMDQPTERIGLVEAAIAADADAQLAPDAKRTDESGAAPDKPVAAEPVEPPAAKKKSRIGKGNQATAADVALLRERADVRNRCIAAVVVPFILYTVVLFLIGSIHVYLIWVWIPLVTAGVLAGSILDAAHRRAG